MENKLVNRVITFKNLAGIVLLPAVIDGVEGLMAFDTGAMETALNKNRFPGLAGESKEIAKFDGAVGTAGAEELRLSRMTVGGVAVGDTSVLLMDMDYVEKSLRTLEPELCFLGSVGIDAFGRAPVLLDYERFTVTLSPDVDISGAEMFPLSMEALPVVTLRLGGKSRRFVLDTGANTCLLSAELAEAFPVTPVDGAPGVYTIPPVELGGRTFDGVPAVFTDLSHIKSRVDVDGVIGCHILSRQPSLLDFQGERLYLF